MANGRLLSGLILAGLMLLTVQAKAGIYVWAKTNANDRGVWSDTTSWTSGAVPTDADDAYFYHSIVGPWTNEVTGSRVISKVVHLAGSVDDNGIGNAVTTLLDPGVTLTVTNGFTVGRDVPEINRPWYNFAGDTLVVSNENSDFSVNDTSPNTTRYMWVTMENLNNLDVTVNRFGISDYFFRTSPLSNIGQDALVFKFAKTNVVRASFTDDYNAASFDTAIQFKKLNQGSNNGRRGDGFQLGLTNALYADSLGVAMGSANGTGTTPFGGGGWQLRFADKNSTSPTSSVRIRGASGADNDRMTLLAAGVDSDTGTSAADNQGAIDLRGGMADVLVDQIWLGQNRTNDGNTGRKIVGELDFEWGTVDCNTIIAGNLKYTNGVSAIAGGVLVGINGTLVVNSNITLGLVPADVTGFEAAAAATHGELRIDDGGTAQVNSLTVGGPGNNSITVNSGGTLEVSNGTIGTSSARVGSMTVDGTLAINCSTSVTNVQATTFAATGGTIKVLSLSGVGSYPATIPLVSYANPTAASLSLDLSVLSASGTNFYGYVLNDGISVINAVITTNPPQDLVWNGDKGSDWETAQNWQLNKTFVDGDTATFDDSASGTSVTVSGTVIVGSGGVLVSNITKSYTLGGGTIDGSAILTKDGSGTLTIDGTCKLPITHLAGTVNVGASGNVPAITSSSGTVLNNAGAAGKVVGSGEVNNTGTMDGLDLQAGGVVNNTSGGTISGTFLMQSGTTGTIDASSLVVQGVERAKVFEDSTLVMNGEWDNMTDRLEVRGLLTGSGALYDYTGDANGNQGRLTIAQTSSTFAPGGVDIIGTFYVGGRLDLDKPPARMIIDVDLNNPATNDVVACDKFSNIRGVIEMNNIGAVPFAAGQTFQIYTINFGVYPNVPENTGATVDPAVPGVGLQWDTSTFFTNGILSVVSAPTTSPTLDSTFDGSTMTLSWEGTHLGYQLQVQTNDLATGLNGTWYPVDGSELGTSFVVTNDPANPSVFYRLSNQ